MRSILCSWAVLWLSVSAVMAGGCAETVSIAQIQGSGATSPLAGQSVTTSGVVTERKTNGFFMQMEGGDGNTLTSDGVFVFTGSAPIVHVGDLVCVNGTVTEFLTGPGSASTRTEISGQGIVILSTGNALPSPAVITADDLTGLAGLERYESMRVSVEGMAVYLKRPLFSYMEYPNRITGLRVEGTIPLEEGELATVTGIMIYGPSGTWAILLGEMISNGNATIEPLGANNRDLTASLLNGIKVTAWGIVKPDSIIGNSYIISDDDSAAGIKIITPTTPTVTAGDFVTVTGAAGVGGRVIYL